MRQSALIRSRICTTCSSIKAASNRTGSSVASEAETIHRTFRTIISRSKTRGLSRRFRQRITNVSANRSCSLVTRKLFYSSQSCHPQRSCVAKLSRSIVVACSVNKWASVRRPSLALAVMVLLTSVQTCTRSRMIRDTLGSPRLSMTSSFHIVSTCRATHT